MRRYVTIAVTAVIAALLLPVTVNVATSSLPAAWQPYLWVAWPVSALLAVVLVVQQVRGDRTEVRLDVTQAADALATGVRGRWEAELESQDLVGQALLRTCDIDDLVPGRVVVLGPPGAGKTVAAIVLTLELLQRRASGDPVPVLLPVARWDPGEHLHDWIARRLVEDYTGLTREVAAQLVAAGLVLPVLDGLDELPAESRVSAVIGIDRLAGPLVLTSRVAEYRDALATAGRVLGDAREIVLGTADTDTVIGYVTRGAPDDPRWQPVVARMRAEPAGPLATALARPLLAWLARATYRDPRTDPAELLTTPEEIEHHLLASFVDTRYRDEHPRRPTPGLRRAKQPAYEAVEARRWLGHLALYLRSRDTDGFTWWHLRQTLPRWVLPLVCCGIDCVGGLAGGFVAGQEFLFMMMAGAVCGAVLGAWIVYEVGRGSVPSVVSRLPTALPLRAMTAKFLTMVRGGVAAGLLLATISAIWFDWADFLEVFVATVVMMAAVGIPYGLQEGLEKQLASVSDVRALNPRSSLRASWYANLLTLAGLGLVFFAVPVAAATIMTPLIPPGSEPMGVGGALQVGTGFLVVLTAFMFSMSDWLAYAVAKLPFATRGIFPLRLMRFLDDAHSRGVLRQVGTSYEFRHAGLRDVLAER
ncbi:NACHT domain-containing protein [Lentzea flava]|nr:hypothetical protein [Lentzea flava]MCP2199752.1 hypothetical protein [Lentzea flava]